DAGDELLLPPGLAAVGRLLERDGEVRLRVVLAPAGVHVPRLAVMVRPVVVDGERVLVGEEPLLRDRVALLLDRYAAAPRLAAVGRLVERHAPAGVGGGSGRVVENHGVRVALVVEGVPDVAREVGARALVPGRCRLG